MKNLKGFVLLFMLAAIGFTSCTKDPVTNGTETTIKPEPTEVTTNPLITNRTVTGGDGVDLGCFSIEYPFTLVVDNVNVEITSDEDFDQALTSAATSFDFAYPLTITNEDGTTTSVADADELGAAFASCLPCDGWDTGDVPVFALDEDCYSLVYPVNVINSVGETGTVNNESELADLVAGTSIDTIWFFAYPLTIMDGDGVSVTVNDSDELFNLLLSCNNQPSTTNGSMFACYDIKYPFNITDDAGSVQEITSVDDFFTILLGAQSWSFVFPITLIDENDVETVVNSDEELANALQACGVDLGSYAFDLLVIHSSGFDNPTMSACYDINFPFNVTDLDGNTITLSSNDDAAVQLGMVADIVYPVSVTLASTNETVGIQDEAQLMSIIDACN